MLWLWNARVVDGVYNIVQDKRRRLPVVMPSGTARRKCAVSLWVNTWVKRGLGPDNRPWLYLSPPVRHSSCCWTRLVCMQFTALQHSRCCVSGLALRAFGLCSMSGRRRGSPTPFPAPVPAHQPAPADLPTAAGGLPCVQPRYWVSCFQRFHVQDMILWPKGRRQRTTSDCGCGTTAWRAFVSHGKRLSGYRSSR